MREVLAHLTAGASLTPLRWFAGAIRCRFDFDKQVAMRLAEHLGTTPADTLARFQRVVASTTKPPLPVIAMLGETIVHGEDIRRPLSIHRDYPTRSPGSPSTTGARTSSYSPRAGLAAAASSPPMARSPPALGRWSPARRRH